MATGGAPRTLLLKNVQVLDLSRLLPGPYATQLLVDLGAQVTKLENSETGGDPLRHSEPLCADGNGAMFHALNRGKRSVALPFRDAGTPAKIQKLLADVDVLVESFRPGTLETLLGVSGAEELLEQHPHLVLARISGYGAGPDGGSGGSGGSGDPPPVGHDLNFCANAGVLDMAAVRGWPPPMQFADFAGGAWPTALQIVAALYHRDASRAALAALEEGGEEEEEEEREEERSATKRAAARAALGSWRDRLVDVKMALGAHAALTLPMARRAASGEAVGGGADFLAGGEIASYAVYYTLCGGHIAIAALEPHFWKE
jgi:alpha-methylacyl-CoA racemase